jgi:hypothetical protein
MNEKMFEDKVFNGGKVFIALRTSLFTPENDNPNEHVTLDFLGSYPAWNRVVSYCEKWERDLKLPITIETNGFANWQSYAGIYHSVALVAFREYPELNYERNWHITLQSSINPLPSRTFTPLEKKAQIVDTLWVGYTDKDGNKQWVRWNSSSLFPIPADYAVENLRTGSIPKVNL